MHFQDISPKRCVCLAIVVGFLHPGIITAQVNPCNNGEFQCGNSECIINCWRCDGMFDCEDSSDETNCGNCTGCEFQCSNGRCISDRRLCDGKDNCGDGSDENRCEVSTEAPLTTTTTTESTTSSIESTSVAQTTSEIMETTERFCDVRVPPGAFFGVFWCGTYPCIPSYWVCDIIIDCPNAEDESNCCSTEQFTCDNFRCIEMEQVCDGENDCGDFTDELTCPECPMNVSLAINSSVPITSVGWPGNYPDNVRCQWTVRPAVNRRVLVQFVSFDLEEGFDFLDIGTERGSTSLRYTVSSAPNVTILSPVNESLVFKFVTDGYETRQGFSILLEDSANVDGEFCFLNGLEVVETARQCDGFDDCIDRSDERFCGCGQLEIYLEFEVNTSFTSINYPLSYDNDVACVWKVSALPGQRVYATFTDFQLERADYLFVGQNLRIQEALRYTGDSLPPDIISRGETLYIHFQTDTSTNDRGFRIEMSSINYTTDFVTCRNGIEILQPNSTCDGNTDCFDLSDELDCTQCEPIPVAVCKNLLPYNTTYYPNSTSHSQLATFQAAYQNLSTCTENATLLLCNHIFPPCPNDAQEWMLCRGLCESAKSSCSEVGDIGDCSMLPDSNRQQQSHFCSFKEGDVFETGVCGTRPGFNPRLRIYNGDNAKVGSWPWICSLQSNDPTEGHQCGCSLINNYWIVTAAHCIYAIDIIDIVVFGVINAVEPSPNRQERMISEVVVHPKWGESNTIAYDIALLKLSSPIEYTDYIRPICLATNQDETNKYTNCMVAGWGYIEEGIYPDFLKEISVPLLSPERCGSFEFDWPRSSVTDEMICSDVIQGRGHCSADSGGPLVCQNENEDWNLVGVVSWGHSGCNLGQFPAVYARVSVLLDFVENTLSDEARPCRSDEFQCASGQCLPSLWSQCDGSRDCTDGSDEQDCPCEGDHVFECSGTECIPQSERCNGESNCIGDMDERDCSNCGNVTTISIDVGESYTLRYLDYPNDAYCQWSFSVANGRYIQVHFDAFGVEFEYDNLYIGYEGNYFAIGPFTGPNIPTNFTSGNNSLWITFISDESETDTGFVIVLTDTDTTSLPADGCYPIPDFSCDGKPDGNYLYGDCCEFFWSCSNGNEYKMPCPADLVFNEQTNQCDYPSNVDGCN